MKSENLIEMSTGYGPVKVCRYNTPRVLFSVRLLGTGYEFAELELGFDEEPETDMPTEEGLSVDASGRAYRVERFPLIMHPGKGVLVCDWLTEPPRGEAPAFERKKKRLIEKTNEFRKALEGSHYETKGGMDLFAKHRLPIRPAVFCREMTEEDVGPVEKDSVFIPLESWNYLRERVDQFFDVYPAAQRPTDGRLFLSSIKSLATGPMDHYWSHLDLVQFEDYVTEQLLASENLLSEAV